MEASYSRAYEQFGGTIGTVAVPLLGTAAGSLGFTQAQIDDSDVAYIYAYNADINFRCSGTTVGTGVAGGMPITSGSKEIIRGTNLIRNLQFIQRGATAANVLVILFGGRS